MRTGTPALVTFPRKNNLREQSTDPNHLLQSVGFLQSSCHSEQEEACHKRETPLSLFLEYQLLWLLQVSHEVKKEKNKRKTQAVTPCCAHSMSSRLKQEQQNSHLGGWFPVSSVIYPLSAHIRARTLNKTRRFDCLNHLSLTLKTLHPSNVQQQ